MDRILAVAAESREFAGFKRRSDSWRKLDWPVDFAAAAKLNGREWILVANGPGPKLAGEGADVAAERAGFDTVVSTGFCGALDPALKCGDIFAAVEVVDAAGGESFSAQLPCAGTVFASGSIISIDRVVQTVEEKRKLRSRNSAAVEMEAGAVAARAGRWSKPLFCIRVVTDAAEEGFACDFNAMRDAAGRFNRPRIVLEALRRPRLLVPELLRLDRRCRRAAQTLGDFIADCRF